MIKKNERLRREKISITLKGIKHSTKSIKKMKESKTGVKHTKTHNQNISKGLFGHHVSKKTRKNLSKSITKHYELLDKEEWKQKKQLYLLLKYDPVFIGLILSDASIPTRKSSKNKSFEFVQGEQNLQLVNVTSEWLKDIGISHNISKSLRKRNNTWEYHLQTGNNIIFSKLRELWYKNGKKIVPTYITYQLTEKAIAYWFMGDGSSWWVGKNKNRVIVQLATQGFDKKSVLRLKKIFDNYGINLKVYPKKNGYNLQIAMSSEVEKFMDLINPYMLYSFSYKVKYPKLEVTKIR